MAQEEYNKRMQKQLTLRLSQTSGAGMTFKRPLGTAFSKLDSDFISDIASDSSILRSTARKDDFLDVKRDPMKNQK